MLKQADNPLVYEHLKGILKDKCVSKVKDHIQKGELEEAYNLVDSNLSKTPYVYGTCLCDIAKRYLEGFLNIAKAEEILKKVPEKEDSGSRLKIIIQTKWKKIEKFLKNGNYQMACKECGEEAVVNYCLQNNLIKDAESVINRIESGQKRASLQGKLRSWIQNQKKQKPVSLNP